jgi:hypothetical protein
MPQAEPPIRAGTRPSPADAAPPTLRWAIRLLATEAVGLLVVVIGLVIADLQASDAPSRRCGSPHARP